MDRSRLENEPLWVLKIEKFYIEKRFIFRPRHMIHICQKTELNSRWTVPFKETDKMFLKTYIFLSHNIDDRFSALIFTELNPNPHLHLESAFGMRIPDVDPGDQNQADSCRCGSATLKDTHANCKGLSYSRCPRNSAVNI
jgi:hypothetical protein